MKKIFNYAVALLACAAVSFTSCNKDDDDDKNKNDNKQQETPVYTPANPETLGQQSQSVVSKLGDGSEGNLMQAVNQLTDADATQAAKVIFEYYKNKQDNAWVESFAKAAATPDMGAEKVKALICQAVEKMEQMGILNDKVTANDLVTALIAMKNAPNTTPTPADTTAQAAVSGAEAAAQYEAFFDANHDEIMEFAGAGMEEAVAKYMALEESKQNMLLAAVKDYNANKDNEQWVSEFIGAIAAKYTKEEADKVKSMFETFGPMAAMLG